MPKKRKNKIVLFLCSFGAILLIVLFSMSLGRKYCMGVLVITEEELLKYTETTEFDISELLFEKEKVSVDWPRNQIYISQSVENLDNYFSLQGKLEAENSIYELFFLKTKTLYDLSGAVKNGQALTLIMKSGTSYQRVPVVITTLPIMYLKIEGTGTDEQGRDIVNGKMTLWNSANPASASYQTVTSMAEWRMRGNSTRIYPKLAWKLNLRDENGQNNNVDFLGLGSDDDWILNPMSMDDTCMKEKLVQELWEQLDSETDHNYKMSQGEYIELFINGAYQGIYLLQRRVDIKYLGLNRESDILMKGVNTWEAETVFDAYEMVSSPLETEETYRALENALNFKENHSMNTANFIDVSLLLQLISGVDNYGYKNTFYALKKNDNNYELYLIPWDTDLSLGVTWGYDYEQSMGEIIERYEMQTMRKESASLDVQIANRWKELRASVYSEENILLNYKKITEQLLNSGALKRDEEQWGLLHEGEDTRENLEQFIKERLLFLDEYYAAFNE